MNLIARRVLTALATAAIVVAAILCAPLQAIAPAVACLALLAGAEYAQLLRRRRPLGPVCASAFLAVGLLVIIGGLSALPLWALRHGPMMLLYVVAIVKISDMGGFAFGMTSARLLKGGNHKLCPAVSPNKSWEGLFGSVFASCLVSCLFMSATQFGWGKALAFGVTAALVGTAGDLVESRFKRWAGAKDSATFMPAGLGGFLDMLDSLLFAPAVLLPFA